MRKSILKSKTTETKLKEPATHNVRTDLTKPKGGDGNLFRHRLLSINR